MCGASNGGHCSGAGEYQLGMKEVVSPRVWRAIGISKKEGEAVLQ
jgi:hypothetical protein